MHGEATWASSASRPHRSAAASVATDVDPVRPGDAANGDGRASLGDDGLDRSAAEILADMRAALSRRLPPARRQRLALAAPIVLVIVMAVAKRWTSAIGFVYFRVVDQVLAGNGPVLNAGQRVEATMSPAWTAVLVVADIVSPFRLEVTALVTSVACLAAAMGLATGASADLMGRLAPGVRLVPLGSAAFAAVWPVWIWASGGTETALVCLWFGGVFWLLTRWAQAGATGRWCAAPPTTLVVVGGGWVVRPELATVSILFVGLIVATCAATWRRRLGTIGVAFAVPFAFQVARMGYYGLLVPVGVLSRDALTLRVGQGWAYVWNFVGPYGLLVPVVALALGVLAPLTIGPRARGSSRLRLVAVIMSTAGVVHAASLALVGGDFVHARLLVPSLFAVLAPVFTVPVQRRRAVAIGLTAAWLPVCLVALRTDGRSDDIVGTGYAGAGRLTHEDYGWPTRGAEQMGVLGPGLYRVADGTVEAAPLYIATTRGHAAVATSSPGLVGYVVGPGTDVVDLSGTLEPTVAHVAERSRWFGGLVKDVPSAWLLAALTDSATAVVPGLLDTSTPVHSDPHGLDALESSAWADFAVSCPPLRRLADASQGPLGPGRFLTNLRDAARNTTLRFSAVPEGAAFELCGTETPVAIHRLLDSPRGPELPSDAPEGTVGITGRCDIVTIVDQQHRWRVISAREWRASVALDPTMTSPQRVVVFTVGPYDTHGSVSEVAVETDGAGNVRVTVTTDFIGEEATGWVSLTAAPIEIVVRPDLLAQRWNVVAGFGVVSVLPMTASFDATTTVLSPQLRADERVGDAGSERPTACNRIARSE